MGKGENKSTEEHRLKSVFKNNAPQKKNKPKNVQAIVHF